MESSVPHSWRTVWANRHVLWPHQLPSHVSNDDEYNIPIRRCQRRHFGLHGRYCDSHKEIPERNTQTTSSLTSKTRPWNIGQTRSQWPLLKTWKMCLQTRWNRIPGSHRRKGVMILGPIFIFPLFSTIYSVLSVTRSPLVPLHAAQTATKSSDKSPDGSPDYSAVRYHMPSLCSPQHSTVSLFNPSWIASSLPHHDETASSWWSYT